MKFQVLLKDPDGFCDGISEAAMEASLAIDGAFTEREREAVWKVREETFREFVSKWVEYGEYITIEFDTEANTATVVELGK